MRFPMNKKEGGVPKTTLMLAAGDSPFISDIYSGTREGHWEASGHTEGSIIMSWMDKGETGREGHADSGLSALKPHVTLTALT